MRPVSTPAAVRVGTMALSPTAVRSADTVNVSEVPFHDCEENDEALRPSSQVSICRDDTTGTPWALAELTVAVASTESTASVWALMV